VIKLLITGSNGQLGSHFNYIQNSLFKIIQTHRKQESDFISMDLTDDKQVYSVINKYNPDVIINTAAITNVDFCQSNKSLARKVNVDTLKKLLKYSSSKTKIIQISTDFIYDGIKGLYNEESLPNPINYYGKTKLEAENILLSSRKNIIIIRVSTLYSNYSNNFYTWVLKNLKNNNSLNIVNDQISNPCYSLNLVNLIFDLILLDFKGKINFGSNNNLSRLDFALEIAESNKLNKDLINISKTENLDFGCRRPLNTSFDLNLCDKLNLKLYKTKDTLNYLDTL